MDKDLQVQVILTSKQMLYNFDLSREMLRRWTERGCPKLARGQFDLHEVIKFRDEHIFQNGDDELKKARLRREKAKARREELIAGQMEGLLLSREEVLNHNVYAIYEAKNRFLQLNRTLPPRLIGKDPRVQGDEIKLEVRRILTRFYQGMGKGERSLQP